MSSVAKFFTNPISISPIVNLCRSFTLFDKPVGSATAMDIPYAGIFLMAFLVPSKGSTTNTASEGPLPILNSPISSLIRVTGLSVSF